MGTTGRVLARALTWPLAPALFVANTVVLLQRPATAGSLLKPADLPYVAATIVCWLVGVVLTGRVFAQAAGWAFLGLGTALAWSGVPDAYADLALNSHPELPAAHLAATLGDTSFVWWFVFLALVLQFTPPVRPVSGRLRSLPTWTVVAGVVYQVGALLRSTHLGAPYESIVSPWAIAPLSGVIAWVAGVAVFVVGLCVIASTVRLIRVWRRAEREVRQQLLWLVAGALPLIPSVVASFAVSYAGDSDIAGYLLSASIVTIAVGATLSVLRYRLYDVERVVTDSAAYAIASAAVIVIFGVVVVVVSRTTPVDARSQLPTILATLAGAGAARVSYVWGRRAVERRINRERFDAVTAIRSGLAEPAPDLDALLPTALRDPHARVLYPTEGSGWVTSDGRAATLGQHSVEVWRHGAVTAKIEFDCEHNERGLVQAVAHEAAAEIDNVALRAQLARQVELISESRSRLATAHLEERRRIERDLHDGAQQRLLALALQLQSAQLNGGANVLRDEVDRAVAELGLTVQELRDLAGGLQPAALAGGGLLAAVVDLVSRIPVEIRYDVVDRRFPPGVEGAAWFVIAEAVANAVKHAGISDVSITVRAERSLLRVVVADRGVGHADPHGRGLQGLADRVSAMHGTLRIAENQPHGTIVEAELPCVS
jgi:signal transduction histidine kinase